MYVCLGRWPSIGESEQTETKYLKLDEFTCDYVKKKTIKHLNTKQSVYRS
jgi:hypothetical protein